MRVTEEIERQWRALPAWKRARLAHPTSGAGAAAMGKGALCHGMRGRSAGSRGHGGAI